MNEGWPMQRVWKATALSQQLANHEAKYRLQPRGQAPYIQRGIEAGTAVGPNGNSLKLVCTAEAVTPISGTTVSPSPYAQTISLSGIQIPRGTMYKNIDNGYTSWYVNEPSNPTSEAIDPCASPGLTTTYYAQPPGVPSDLQTYTFPTPTSFPGGATQAAIMSPYERETSDDPRTLCTSTGCLVPALAPFGGATSTPMPAGISRGRGRRWRGCND